MRDARVDIHAVRCRRSSPQCRAATAASAGAYAGDWWIGPRISYVS
jgi:hypothetical protein